MFFLLEWLSPKLYRYNVAIPMGTNCDSLVDDLFVCVFATKEFSLLLYLMILYLMIIKPILLKHLTTRLDI